MTMGQQSRPVWCLPKATHPPSPDHKGYIGGMRCSCDLDGLSWYTKSTLRSEIEIFPRTSTIQTHTSETHQHKMLAGDDASRGFDDDEGRVHAVVGCRVCEIRDDLDVGIDRRESRRKPWTDLRR